MATKKLTPKQLEALRKGREKRAKQLKSVAKSATTRKKTAKNATVKRKSLNGYERKTCLALSKLSANDINTIIRHYFNTDIFSHFYFQQLARKSNDAARQWAINTIADEVSYDELRKDGFI